MEGKIIAMFKRKKGKVAQFKKLLRGNLHSFLAALNVLVLFLQQSERNKTSALNTKDRQEKYKKNHQCKRADAMVKNLL